MKVKGAFKRSSFLLALILILVMVASACSSKTNPTASSTNNSSPSPVATDAGKPDISKEVNLKMVLLGSKPADFETVWAEVNKKLKEKINATVDVQFLSWSEWTQKYPLLFAANENFDLIYTANWANYLDQARKGGFLTLTDDLIKKYAPMTASKLSKIAWDQSKVDGKLYMVPNNNPSEYLNKLVLIREDLRKKYNIPPVNSVDSFTAYLKAVAKNEKGVIPFETQPSAAFHEWDEMLLLQQNEWKQVDFNLPLAFKLDDGKAQLFDEYDTPEFKNLLVYYKDLADNNVWSKDILNNKINAWDDFKAGKLGSIDTNLNTVTNYAIEMRRDHPQFEVSMADLTPDKKKEIVVSTQNGIAIHATSKNPERALMLIDLLQNDREIHDLTVYGIANKHYVPVGDDKMQSTADTKNYSISSWGWISPLDRVNEKYPKETVDMKTLWATKVYHYPLETFVFDNSKVKAETANIKNVMLHYGLPLEYGLINDLDKGRADLISKLKAAGLDTVQKELQNQINDFLAKNQ